MRSKILLFVILLSTTAMTAHSQKDNAIIYVHDAPASFKSQFLQKLMAVLGKKKTIEKSITAGKFSSEAMDPPQDIQLNFVTQMSQVNGRNVWTFQPKQDNSQKVLLYIHGGGYISNLTKYDWDLVKELLIKTHSTVLVADYPLAPAYNYKDVYTYFDKLYIELLSSTSPKDIIFMGNSAGGGIALGFAQKLRNERKQQPSQIIMNSPWLDITMSNPEIMEIDKKDKLLGIKGLKMAGELYAAELDAINYMVSPIYGDLSGLGEIAIFIGTHDLFLADSRKLKQRMEALNIPIKYFEYPKMFHVWVALTNLKESQHAINQMAALINTHD